jgi:hypothetical protein
MPYASMIVFSSSKEKHFIRKSMCFTLTKNNVFVLGKLLSKSKNGAPELFPRMFFRSKFRRIIVPRVVEKAM